MSDLSFDFFKAEMNLDLVVNNSEVQIDESLKTSVLISLFTDVRCEKSELPLGEKSQRGYFGDAIFGEQTGSKLWLLNRSKQTNETLLKAKEYAKNSLDWLVLDGFAKNVNVEVCFDQNKKMILKILIIKNNDEKLSVYINDLWSHL